MSTTPFEQKIAEQLGVTPPPVYGVHIGWTDGPYHEQDTEYYSFGTKAELAAFMYGAYEAGFDGRIFDRPHRYDEGSDEGWRPVDEDGNWLDEEDDECP
jgi:hypothetical protein